MKTSNKLLLGFFLLVIVVITIGLVILKVEMAKFSLNTNKDTEYKTKGHNELAMSNVFTWEQVNS